VIENKIWYAEKFLILNRSTVSPLDKLGDIVSSNEWWKDIF